MRTAGNVKQIGGQTEIYSQKMYNTQHVGQQGRGMYAPKHVIGVKLTPPTGEWMTMKEITYSTGTKLSGEQLSTIIPAK